MVELVGHPCPILVVLGSSPRYRIRDTLLVDFSSWIDLHNLSAPNIYHITAAICCSKTRTAAQEHEKATYFLVAVGLAAKLNQRRGPSKTGAARHLTQWKLNRCDNSTQRGSMQPHHCNEQFMQIREGTPVVNMELGQ